MKVAIMQPYFFPYIGYLQLLECSDIFVIHDDVQYIKGGWVNRNRILFSKEPYWLTFPVQKDSFSLCINERSYIDDKKERNSLLRLIESAYQKAPYYKEVHDLLLEIMDFESNNVSEFNANIIARLKDFMKIECQILLSSQLEKDNSLKGQDRVIEINRCLGSSHYINPMGGVSLYQEQSFVKCGVELSFLQPDNVQYHQFAEPFIPSLSIIDVLMFCSLDEIRMLLKQYRLIKSADMA